MIKLWRTDRMRNIKIELFCVCEIDKVTNESTMRYGHMERIDENMTVKRMFKSELTNVRRLSKLGQR